MVVKTGLGKLAFTWLNSGGTAIVPRLQVVEADRGCFSCVLGGEDGRTLFVVANRYGAQGASDGVVLTERVDVPGAPKA